MRECITAHANQVKISPTKSGAQKAKEGTCRICLSEEESSLDPLITPCKCAGSMEFIHHLCLKSWFKSKRVVRHNYHCTAFFWSGLECELCKTHYPYEISLNGQMLNIIDYDCPKSKEYLVLESISSSVNKVIYVVDLQHSENFFIGRGQEADVRVSDISVSRHHATVFKAYGNFYLCDNNSRFGTIIQLKTPLLVPKSAQLQQGRTALNLSVTKTCRRSNKLQACKMVTLDGKTYFPSLFCSEEFRAKLELGIIMPDSYLIINPDPKEIVEMDSSSERQEFSRDNNESAFGRILRELDEPVFNPNVVVRGIQFLHD